MHHNLSTLEKQVPLIASTARFYSPWKQEERAASGLLHAIYVFTCLLAYFQRMVCERTAIGDYARKRIVTIREEIAIVDRTVLVDALTPHGQWLCRALYEAVQQK